MTISGSPRNASFFQGLHLTFTCSILLDDAVDTTVTVRGIWNRNGTRLVTDERITISNSPLTVPPYPTNVSFNPLDSSDIGTYVCTATINPRNTTFITGISSSISQNITVSGTP